MPPDNTSPFSSSRFMIAFVLTVLIAFGVYISWKLYEFRRGEEAVRNLAGALEDWEREQYERAMADTYGGTTPEETLRLYIDAVEKGDYELASRYFIEEKRQKEINSLNNAPIENIKNINELLKDSSPGELSGDGGNFYIYKPLYVEFIKYPNNIWKIVEI